MVVENGKRYWTLPWHYQNEMNRDSTSQVVINAVQHIFKNRLEGIGAMATKDVVSRIRNSIDESTKTIFQVLRRNEKRATPVSTKLINSESQLFEINKTFRLNMMKDIHCQINITGKTLWLQVQWIRVPKMLEQGILCEMRNLTNFKSGEYILLFCSQAWPGNINRDKNQFMDEELYK